MIWKKQPVGSKLSDLQNNKASKDTATQNAAGLMSAADKTKLDRVSHTTIITATTIADLKTNLLNAVNGVDSADMLAVRISTSFSSDGFTSGSTYGGYAYNIYKASGTTSYFSVIISNNIGEDMFIGYNNGTWKFNSLNSKFTALIGSAHIYRDNNSKTTYSFTLSPFTNNSYKVGLLIQHDAWNPCVYLISLSGGVSPQYCIMHEIYRESSSLVPNVSVLNMTMTVTFETNAYGGCSLIWLN